MLRRVVVYRDASRTIDVPTELARIRASLPGAHASADAFLSHLIDVAEFESAVVDALSPDEDLLGPVQEQLRRATLAAARTWLARKEGVDSDCHEVAPPLDSIDPDTLPRSASRRVSEGYAYYALFPDTYAASARRFAEVERPARVCVVGIRSIGCSLSAVVAALLQQTGCEVSTLTVRPRGHPFDRELRLGDDVESFLRRAAAVGCVFAIVDEGPGLSGSSFAAVSAALARLDVPAHRVVFFPSWDPDPEALRSDTARRIWRAHARYWTDAASVGITPERLFGIASPTRDWSGGRWRADVFGPDDRQWPAVQPQHERWKTYAPGERRLFKFVGLGRYGEIARRRAEQLGGLGLTAPPGELRGGFLDLAFVEGTVVRADADEHVAAAVGRHIGLIAREFRTEATVDPEPLLHMFETNVRELTGDCPVSLLEPVRANVDVIRNTRAVEIDGRVLPHEWLTAANRLTKVDGLDHHRDHFFPGAQSPAWDLAAAIVEFEMTGGRAQALLDAYARASGDCRAGAQLPFYIPVYVAFRSGYLALASESVPDPRESQRLRAAIPSAP
jgi:hypothetical protein